MEQKCQCALPQGLVPACRDSQQELKDRIRQAVALPVRIAIKGDCLATARAWAGPCNSNGSSLLAETIMRSNFTLKQHDSKQLIAPYYLNQIGAHAVPLGNAVLSSAAA